MYYVNDVIDGDTFNVTPNWQYEDREGNRVRIAGYDAPERDTLAGILAKNKLHTAIYGKFVTLNSKAIDTYGRMVCDVYVDGTNVVDLIK